MYVQKLTLTPAYKGFHRIIRYCPSPESASTLIKDRISMFRQDGKIPRAMRRLPKRLRGWVNPDCWVHKTNV